MGTGKQSHHQTASRNSGGMVANRTDNRVTIENVSIHGFFAMLEKQTRKPTPSTESKAVKRKRQWQICKHLKTQ
jgi:hypothetical protein